MKISRRKSTVSARSKTALRLNIIRRLLYSALLLGFYVIMVCGIIRNFQPALLLPLAVAVAMREKETGASVFGAVCGLAFDMAACLLFGFTGVLLMIMCCLTSFLSLNLIKVNIVNHFLLTALACAFIGFMDYFFNYGVWGGSTEVVLSHAIIPSYVSGLVLAPLVYLLVRKIADRFTPNAEL